MITWKQSLKVDINEVIKILMLTSECNSRKRTSTCQLLSHWPVKEDIIIHQVFSNVYYFSKKHAQSYLTVQSQQ